MGFIGSRMGSWWVQSESDSRWNKSGRAGGYTMLGGPSEMYDWISECGKKYGHPPKDCEHGFMKD